ncbi:GAF domain-containing protein [Arcobacter arenosus]|jgi:light-regulated signal transduction histidine kinase (bacteriophytochrome)|uniref:GAF domain-containing protein n=1 Tax=Arcobacter arenosus TaxID=2576037 RepID=UPI003BACFE5E
MQNYNIDELLKTCEQEQLHLTGMIQSFASLLIFDSESFIISHVSENIKDFLSIDYKDLLGKNIKKVLKDFYELLDEYKLNDEGVNFFYKTLKKEKLLLKLSKIDNSIIIDIQKIKEEFFNATVKYNTELTIAPYNDIEYDDYKNKFLKLIYNQLKFDRILVYQFQNDWSGQVIAEKVSNRNVDSYLGLMFPASDIPKIARDMYMINPYRLIADVNSKNIDILTIDGTKPDLTFSDIRSVSPIHIEYLKNMGVMTSLSIPIIIADKLWGLLACHNFTYKRIDPLQRNILLNLIKQFSIGLQNFFAKKKVVYLDLVEHKINFLLKNIFDLNSFEIQIQENKKEFLNLLNSDGLIIIYNSQIWAIGSIPENNSLRNLDKYFLDLKSNKIVSNSISRDFELNFLGPVGVLGIKVESKNSTLRSYWFRNEISEKLTWAGNPNKSIVEYKGTFRLSPRSSFEKFVEEKHGFSNKFDNQEELAALKFINQFFKIIEGNI